MLTIDVGNCLTSQLRVRSERAGAGQTFGAAKDLLGGCHIGFPEFQRSWTIGVTSHFRLLPTYHKMGS